MLVNNHKYIKSYSVTKLECGVIELYFHCNQEELYFHRYTDEDYLICGSEKEFEENGWASEFMISIPNFIDGIKKEDNIFIYVVTSMHIDDSITFFYIPYKRNYFKTKKYIIE